MKLLHIDSSILGGDSVSRQLSARLVDQIREDEKNVEVTYYDLTKNPFTHLSGDLYAAQAADPASRTPEQQKDVEMSARAMDDFLAADIIVIGAPMYNFSVSSQLKAWIDRVAVAGKTFRYTANGPEGLAGGKHVIVVSSRGGFYAEGTPLAAIDHQEPYLRAVFNFLGITDIKYIRAEGIAIDAEQRARAIAGAVEEISHCKERRAA